MTVIRPNRIKQKLAAGETAITVAGLDHPDLIDLLGPAGLDGVWLEAEHGAVDFGRIPDLTRACDLWGITSVVRVNALNYGMIYRTLDLGAQGICVPHIDTGDDATKFVEAAKFAPLGRRGLFTSRQGYGVADYLKTANDHTLLIALIEDIKAVENLSEILKVDHIDVFFVAPSDLAASMGLIGQLDHPDVTRVREEALKQIIASGRIAGTTLMGNQGGTHWAGMGVRMFATSIQPWLTQGMAALAREVGEAARSR